MTRFISSLFMTKLVIFSAAPANIGNACIPSNIDFLGLKAWYYYLPRTDFDGCSIRNFTFLPSSGHPADIPLILLAIVDDLLTIAGIVAVAFVIVGAFRYVASQGNPEETGRAQSTIINALIGTAVAITASVFVNFLGQSLGG
jgi:hypothetical protein